MSLLEREAYSAESTKLLHTLSSMQYISSSGGRLVRSCLQWRRTALGQLRRFGDFRKKSVQPSIADMIVGRRE